MLYLPSEQGQGLVEYGLILVLVSISVFAVLSVVGGEINGAFSDVATAMSNTN